MRNQKLINLRALLGKTQQEMAVELSVSRPHYSSWESGKATMPPRRWAKILKLLGVDEAHVTPRGALSYDAEGYPIGFSKAAYRAGGAIYETTPDHIDPDDLEEEALQKLEGAEYEARALERRVLMFMRLGNTREEALINVGQPPLA